MQLEKWKRNAIFKAIEEGALDPRECSFDFGDDESRITHLPSGSTFVLEGGAGHYTSTMQVGDGMPLPLKNYTWPPVPERIERWAGEVKRDVETPDLWAELQREREIITGALREDAQNTPFTSDEQAEIAKSLRQIREYIRANYELSAEQYARIDTRLEGLEDAARRGVGRIDWRDKLVGVFLGLVIDAVLPPDPVRQILILVLRGLAPLFDGHGIPELPGAPPELV